MRYESDNELYHFGIKGQKWGVRNYQNEDGTLTPAGKERYGVGDVDANGNVNLEKLKDPKTCAKYCKNKRDELLKKFGDNCAVPKYSSDVVQNSINRSPTGGKIIGLMYTMQALSYKEQKNGELSKEEMKNFKDCARDLSKNICETVPPYLEKTIRGDPKYKDFAYAVMYEHFLEPYEKYFN